MDRNGWKDAQTTLCSEAGGLKKRGLFRTDALRTWRSWIEIVGGLSEATRSKSEPRKSEPFDVATTLGGEGCVCAGSMGRDPVIE